MQVAGVWLTIRAAGMISVFELAGVRQANHQRPVEFKATGPFGLVRHPIYLGWILLVFASTPMTASKLLFAVVSSAYLLAAIPWEEASLVEAFGEKYRAYQTPGEIANPAGPLVIYPRQPLVGRVNRAGSAAFAVASIGLPGASVASATSASSSFGRPSS